MRQLPTLPRRLQRSTLGLRTLNCCVRNGNRWNRPGIITALLSKLFIHSKLDRRNSLQISCEITCNLSFHSSIKKAQALSAVNRYCLRKSVSIRSALMPPTKRFAHFSAFLRNLKSGSLLINQALDRLVLVSCMRCRTSTPSLSTSSSARGLTL